MTTPRKKNFHPLFENGQIEAVQVTGARIQFCSSNYTYIVGKTLFFHFLSQRALRSHFLSRGKERENKRKTNMITYKI
jgi:hypothetical protein